jgi:regulation of enolase protein 1 (concanavalin A-like superfamily)
LSIRCRLFMPWACVCALFLMPAPAAAQTYTLTGEVTAYSTIYSLGVEWDVVGDTDHDARVDVEYKPAASSAWLPAAPLMRVDYNGRNMLAGSVMFLSPDTSYQVRLTLFDPDGGGETREVSVRTLNVPAPPAGRVFHVVPGSGGGDGSLASPFRGVVEAQAAAQPGDTFLMHGGFYGPDRLTFYVSGAPGAYIVWKAAGDGEVVIDGLDVYNRGHVWFEGLTVRDQMYGLRTDGAPADVVILRCAFINNFYNIYLNGGGSAWYIADNRIDGATPYLSQSQDGEGIELNGTSGHTVAHNSITNVADGVSTPRTNVDIFGNDIFNTADDGLELDFGLANVRAWQNRIHNAYHNGISFQPQNGGPWYIIRNQIVGSYESPFKFRTTDRFVLLNNTIVNYASDLICCSASHLLRGFIRNNLWVSAVGGQLWNLLPLSDWRTDVDYDGFDWGNASYPLVWDGSIYYDVPSFAQASGLEAHGIRIFKDQCFADFRVPGPTPTEIPPQLMTLRGDCNAIDAGAIVANLSEPFAGAAPDLGAYEFGLPAPFYGPRPVSAAASVSITSPHAGAVFVAPATLSVQGVASSDQGVAQVDVFANGAYVGSAGGSPFSVPWTGVGAGTFSLTARLTDGAGVSTLSPPVTIVVGAERPSPPPSGWADGDVGSVSRSGSAGVSGGGTWSLTASGSDVWGTSDAFHFVYRSLTGDGTMTARVASVSQTDVWTKAGVMMRANLGAASPHAFMIVTPGAAKGLAFQRRVSEGGESTHTSAGPGAPPEWVRLTRAGDVVTAQYSVDGASWSTAGRETITMGQTIYVGLALTSHDDAQLASASFDNVNIDSSDGGSSSPLPSPWGSGDIGDAGAAGSATVSSGVWTIRGSGADVWGTSDAFQFASQPLAGDGTIVARVTSLAGGNVWAKAGVMLRETQDADSPQAFALVTPGGANGVAFQRRVVRSDVSVHTSGPAMSAPVWLKLVRRGALITASWSADGQQWTLMATETMPMASTIYAGLAVTSHDAGALATAMFDNVSVVSDGTGWTSQDVGAVNPAGSTSTDGAAWSITASGADIWGSDDAFRFTYQSVTGNFDVLARVASVEAVDQWTKAGVMIRASADSRSAHASMFATPGVAKGTAFQRRQTFNAESVHTGGPALAPAVWVRLTRQGSVITAWSRVAASDAWVPIASDTVDLPSTVLVGLAVTSHQENTLATATFDNVTIVPAP